MGNVLVNDSSLTAIGNAIREKNESTTKYKPSEMAQAILDIKSGGRYPVITIDELTLSGPMYQLNLEGRLSSFFNKYYDYITFNNATDFDYMHQAGHGLERAKTPCLATHEFIDCENLKEVVITDTDTNKYLGSGNTEINGVFSDCISLEKIVPPTSTNIWVFNIIGQNLFRECHMLSDLGSNWNLKITTLNNYTQSYTFYNCYSLKTIPDKLLIGLATGNYQNGQYTNGSASSDAYTHKYDHTFDGCLSLRKLDLSYKDWYTNGSSKLINNELFVDSFNRLAMLDTFKFTTHTLAEGYYYCTQSGFTIDLTNVGYCADEADATVLGGLYGTPVTTKEEYDAQKNNENWWSTNPEYSRFNLNSFKTAIQYLPRMKNGATATIKFKSGLGSGTDAGGITTDGANVSSLLSYATEYGWTVALV